MVSAALLRTLACPRCGGALREEAAELQSACGARYPVRGGVPIAVDASSPLHATAMQELRFDPRGDVLRGTDAARQAQYWETDSAHRPPRHPVVAGFARQRWRHIERTVDLSDVRTALDVGAGSGFSSLYAPAHIDVTATDGSLKMLAQHPGEKKVIADAMRLPFFDRSFDLVFCWELLHHVDEPWRVLKEMARVARRLVLFFEPNPWNLAQAAFSIVDPEHRWVLRFTKRYTLGQVERAGLRVVRYERCGLIFPNKTPEPLYPLLSRLPFRIPRVGISQLVVAVVG
jgi:SAM-dependent methyltransferase